jgi:hypothetical protein
MKLKRFFQYEVDIEAANWKKDFLFLLSTSQTFTLKLYMLVSNIRKPLTRKSNKDRKLALE